MIRAASILSDFLHYRYAVVRNCAPTTLQTMNASVTSFSRHLDRPALLEDLDREILIDYMAVRRQSVAPATVYGNRRDLLSLWNCAYDEGLVSDRPESIPAVKVPTSDPDAWLVDEYRAILDACRHFPEPMKNGVRKSDFLRAFVLVDYSTGLRCSAVLSLLRENLEADGSILAHWSSQKHRHTQRVWLHSDAVEAVEKMGHHKHLLPYPYARTNFYKLWKKLLKQAGVPVVSRRSGPQKLRRTAASYLDRDRPGAARKFLGHRTAGLAERCYLDPRITGGKPLLPPTIAQS